MQNEIEEREHNADLVSFDRDLKNGKIFADCHQIVVAVTSITLSSAELKNRERYSNENKKRADSKQSATMTLMNDDLCEFDRELLSKFAI